MSPHPATEQMAAYLSGTLSPPEQAAFETHLATCRPCRQEMTSAQRLITSAPSRRRWLLVVAPAAAAAALALVLLYRGPRAAGPADELVREGRDAAAEGAAALVAFAPADRDTVDGRGLVFIWASPGDRPLYRITVTDGSGRAVWLRSTSDTAAALPADVPLAPGHTYFWYVDALDAGGTSLTTGTHSFTVSP
jgi:anti-sigma factor RsiW